MVVLSVHTDLSDNAIKSGEQEEVFKTSMERKIRQILGKERQIYVFMNHIRDVVGIIDGYCRETERIHEEIYQEINEIAGTVPGRSWSADQSFPRRENTSIPIMGSGSWI